MKGGTGHSSRAGILTWLTYSMVKMTHNLYIFCPCRELPLSSLLFSSFIVFIMMLSPSSEFIPSLFPFLIHSPSLFHVPFFSKLPGALIGIVIFLSVNVPFLKHRLLFLIPVVTIVLPPQATYFSFHMAPVLASITCTLGDDQPYQACRQNYRAYSHY
jgi:hypothetical protein